MATEREQKDRHFQPRRVLIPILIAVAVLLAIGIVPRISQQSELNAGAAEQDKTAPVVEVIHPNAGPVSNVIDVPGTVEAIEQASVNPRATGYANKVLVNIGDVVKSGQILATISAPDADEEVVQARAQLVQSEDAVAQEREILVSAQQAVTGDQASYSHAQAAKLAASSSLIQLRNELAEAQRTREEQVQAYDSAKANERYAYLTNYRNQELVKQGCIAQETADQTLAAYQTAAATTKSSDAAVTVADASIDAARAAVVAGVDAVSEADEDIKTAAATLAGAISTEESDRDAVLQAEDGVQANASNLRRLAVLQNFETVRSPFAGVVVARNIDPGAYINEGGSSSSTSVGSTAVGATATGTSANGNAASGSASSAGSSSATAAAGAGLFTVARFDVLRIYVNVPQSDAAFITPGASAQITCQAFPGRTFTGVVSHSTVVLDPGSRTLVAEIDMRNPNGLLRPGMFSMVRLSVPQASGVLMIPDSALVTGASGTEAITVSSDNTLHFQPIQVGDDNGQEIEVVSGLNANDQVVSGPSSALTEGEVVQPVAGSAATGVSTHKHKS